MGMLMRFPERRVGGRKGGREEGREVYMTHSSHFLFEGVKYLVAFVQGFLHAIMFDLFSFD